MLFLGGWRIFVNSKFREIPKKMFRAANNPALRGNGQQKVYNRP
jgi:hypothetical protein